MKTIMVDMDDVLTYGNFSKILEDYLGYIPDYSNIKNYYIQDILGDRKDDFFNKFKDMDMYKDATLLPDCYEVLKELSKYYNIYICTDYIWREIVEFAGNNLKNKYNFIKIDDRINNIEGAPIKLLFTAWHNKDITDVELKKRDIIRVNNWKDIKKFLLNCGDFR